MGKDQGETTRAQLRAYLSVVIGGAIYQERHRELKFQAKPVILNNGETPAYRVRYRIKTEILTDAEAVNFVFTEPPDVPQSQASIGPKELRNMSALLDRYIPDNDVYDVCNGTGKCLYVWGVVHYDDVFKRPHFTQFAHKIWWLRDRSNVEGIYDGRFGLPD